MPGDSGFGPPPRRRGSGNVLTHIIKAVLGAALAIGLLLSFYKPGSGGLSQAACTWPPGRPNDIREGADHA
jgi:hypothetical protein